MKLLVLDSSGLVASVALIEDDRLIAEYTTGNKLTHSQTLLPMLDEVIKRTSFEIEDIDAVAVAKGPGSFTGLRIGAATAKGLGLNKCYKTGFKFICHKIPQLLQYNSIVLKF